MTYKIVLQEEAVLEIQAAFEWYENQKSGLGYELLTNMELCFKRISQQPNYYTFINERYRRVKTNRFPYLIVYEIKESNVFIIGVRHAKRKPIQ